MSFLTVVIRKENGRLAYVDKDGKVSDFAKEEANLRLDYQKPYNLRPGTADSTVPVTWLPKTASLSRAKIVAMTTGSSEEFVMEIGFLDEETRPKNPTVGIWMNFNKDGLAMHEYVVGGKHKSFILFCRWFICC